MATFLSLCSLLDNDKLMESNFGSWYRKLKIVLEHGRILHLRSQLPIHVEQSETLIRSGLVTTMVHCIMLAAMSDKFSCRFETTQPNEMLQMLEDSFGTPDDVERHKTSCAIFNARMWDGVYITDLYCT